MYNAYISALFKHRILSNDLSKKGGTLSVPLITYIGPAQINKYDISLAMKKQNLNGDPCI